MTKLGVVKMGSNSTKQKSKTEAVSQHQNNPNTSSINGVKHVLLVHNSSTEEELKTVRNFRDALIQIAPGSIKIAKLVNLAEDENEDLKDSSWLERLNNVILIRLTPENVDQVADILRRNTFVDENNHLHDRVMAIAFGKALPTGWPPSGAQRQVADQRDFVFELENEENLKPKDFDGAKLNSLVNAIMATN